MEEILTLSLVPRRNHNFVSICDNFWLLSRTQLFLELASTTDITVYATEHSQFFLVDPKIFKFPYADSGHLALNYVTKLKTQLISYKISTQSHLHLNYLCTLHPVRALPHPSLLRPGSLLPLEKGIINIDFLLERKVSSQRLALKQKLVKQNCHVYHDFCLVRKLQLIPLSCLVC